MADIFREVDEDIRRERYAKLWKAYGRYVIGAALALVIGVAATIGWREYTRAQREADGAQFAAALDLARDNIRVNAIAPGYIETDFNRAFFASDAGKAMIARIPQRRLGLASDLDAILLLLAGDGSAFMTGSIVTVDGGHGLAIA